MKRKGIRKVMNILSLIVIYFEYIYRIYGYGEGSDNN